MRLYLNIFKYNVYEFKEHCSVTLSKQYLVNAIPQKKCKIFYQSMQNYSVCYKCKLLKQM